MVTKKKVYDTPIDFKNYPDIKKYLLEYFGDDFDLTKIVYFRMRPDGYYVVLGIKDAEDEFDIIDMASYSGGEWSMQNDGSELITAAQLDKLYIPSQCDWWRIRGEED